MNLLEKDVVNAKLTNPNIKQKDLAKAFNISDSRVSQILKKYTLNNMTSELEKSILNLYLKHSVKEICDLLNVETFKVAHVLKKNKLIYKKHKNINEAVFHIITEHSLYWLGFILAKGSIIKNTLRLYSSDKEHLVKFMEFIGSKNYKLHKKTQQNYTIGESSGISKDTYYLSITNRTLIISIKQLCNFDKENLFISQPLQYSNHFWRGLLDGNGGLYEPKKLVLYGSKSTLEKYLTFINNTGYLYLIKTKIKKYSTQKTYQVVLSGKKANKIISLLYNDTVIYKDKNKKLADKFLSAS